MRILMIAPTPFMADRGCHTQIYLEIKALQAKGHEVVLCTYGLGRDLPDVTTVRCFNFPWYKKLSAGPSRTKILLLPLLLVTTLRTLWRFRPDVVHAHLHEGAVIARICRIFFRKPLYVFDLQGSLTKECVQHRFVSEGSSGYKSLHRLEKSIAGWFPIVTQSDTMVNEARELGVSPDRIFNVKDGVDTDLFHPQPPHQATAAKLGIRSDAPCVVYVGLLETYQGVDVMLEAFAKVSRAKHDTQFLIIGYPNIERYVERAADLGLTRTCFAGRVDYAELSKYLSLGSIAVAPKIAQTEGDGKIYNYMAMGLATVAFDRHVAREILADAGVYATFGDPEALADRILGLLDDPTEVKRLGVLARQRAVSMLSYLQVGERLLEVYQAQGGQR